MLHLIVKRNKVTLKNIRYIAFIIVILFVSTSAISGWFGYDTRQECYAEKVGELMSRWINPLSGRDARLAARSLCKKYPDEYIVKKKLEYQSMSLVELHEKRLISQKKARKDNSSFYREDVEMIDAEIKRRGK